MSTSLLLSMGTTAALLGGIVVAGSLSRGPPLRPLGPDPPAVTAAPGAPTLWVCVTPRSYCTSPPRREGEPCACSETMRGTIGGRVRTDRTAAPADPTGWPSRPAGAGDEPAGNASGSP